MNKKVLIVIVLLALLAGVGAYLFANSQSKSKSENSPTPSSNATASPVPSASPSGGTSDAEQIKAILVAKNNWKADEIKVELTNNDGTYAKGLVGSTTTQAGGGLVFAKKVNGKWEIVYDGNGMILCSALDKYQDFPKTLIEACYDNTAEKLITR